MTVGCVAGDEESYEVFAELLDPVIEMRHGGYKKTDQHKTDLDFTKIKGGKLDENYVLSSRVRTGRSIRGFSLPPHCTRAERRGVEKAVVDALNNLDGDFKGKYVFSFGVCPRIFQNPGHEEGSTCVLCPVSSIQCPVHQFHLLNQMFYGPCKQISISL